MAQNGPESVDTVDLQFKFHDKTTIFVPKGELQSHVSLLAVSSSRGLLFAGNPSSNELKVALLKELVDAKSSECKLRMRSVSLPHIPTVVACSADGNMLAINYTLNASGFLNVYSTESFLTPNIKCLFNIRLSPEANVAAVQILWNPVITTNVAVVLTNGALNMLNLKSGGNFELHSMDKSQEVQCGCWSPKGKQIVLGFANGKLQQFKPDLTPAKTIACPPGVHEAPFATLAVHWVSTFQFATVFAKCSEDSSPSLYIVNAPKGGTPTYVNYYDICYSSNGPRDHQVSFTHIQQWNLLLMTSANGIDIGILATKEKGETPKWVQYNLGDDSRFEFPMTKDQEETFPIGFAFDTAALHQLTVGEGSLLPVMPMVHALSTHGELLSYNFLNLMEDAVNICSPPTPATDTSGEFRPVEEADLTVSGTIPVEVASPINVTNTQSNADANFSFTSSAFTSTPAAETKDKPAPLFGGAAPPSLGGGTFPQMSSNFAAIVSSSAKPAAVSALNFEPPAAASTSAPSASFTGFANMNSGNLPAFGGFGTTLGTDCTVQLQQKPPIANSTISGSDLQKPLYTVPPSFVPPVVEQTKLPSATITTAAALKSQSEASTSTVDKIFNEMIWVQINGFDAEIKELKDGCNGLLTNLGKLDEVRNGSKRLNELQEIIKQANDQEFELDMQNLRQSLSEAYAMLAECRTKLDMYNDPDVIALTSIATHEPFNRRQLSKLQALLSANQAQLQILQQQVDDEWANHQDRVRRNSKLQMHVPSLHGVYERMMKLKDKVELESRRLNHIKSVLNKSGLISTPSTFKKEGPFLQLDSLTDAMVSMVLTPVVKEKCKKLSVEKVEAIRNFVQQRNHIPIVRPQRPNCMGLNSEVILEMRQQSERKSRERAATNLAKMQHGQGLAKSAVALPVADQATSLAKPTATKPTIPVMPTQAPSQAPITSSGLSFGATGPFVKTTVPIALSKPDETPKPAALAPSRPHMSPTSTASTFSVPAISSLNFNQQIPAVISQPERPKEAIPPQVVQTPMSFAAKVVTSEPTKISLAAPAAQGGFAALSSNVSTPASSTKVNPITDKDNKKPDDVPKPFTLSDQPLTSNSSNIFASTSSTKSIFDGKPGLPGSPSSGFSFSGFGVSPSVAQTQLSTTSTLPSLPPLPTLSTFSFGSAATTSAASLLPANQAIATTTASVLDFTTKSSTPSLFAGFGKSIGESSSSTSSITPTTISSTSSLTPSTTGSFFSTRNSETSLEPTSSTISASSATDSTKSSSISESKTLIPSANVTSTTSNSDSTAAMFGALNVCTPTTKDDTPEAVAASNSFASIGGGSGSTGFSFAAAASEGEATKSVLCTAAATSAPSLFVTSTLSFGKPTITTAPSAAPPAMSSTTTVACTTVGAAVGDRTVLTTTSSALPPFGALSSATTNQQSPLFSAANSFSASSATTANANVTSPFGAAAQSTSPSIFAAAMAATPTTAASVFSSGTAAAAIETNIFGGIPKPDQQPFTGAAAGVFSSSTGSSPFGSPAAGNATAGTGMFGGSGTNTFGAPAAASGSIFGGSSPAFGAAAASPAGGSIFGGAAKPAESTNLFPTAAQSPNSGGGPLFSQSTFGQAATSSGNMFGSPTVQASSTQAFGGGGSIFGGAIAKPAGSIFGGGSSSPAAPTFVSSGFGAFSQSTPAPAFGGSGSFAQGGSSVAQTGFGSPQQTSAFAKPVFGGATFSPPAFGAAPSFGGAATFGSPKPFGSFATPNTAAAPTSPFGGTNQKSNLFETLGASDSGLSFGNLAQSTNANNPKPAFGGSSFMNYRA